MFDTENYKFKVAKQSKKHNERFTLYPEHFNNLDYAIDNAYKRAIMQNANYGIMIYDDENKLHTLAVYNQFGELETINHGVVNLLNLGCSRFFKPIVENEEFNF